MGGVRCVANQVATRGEESGPSWVVERRKTNRQTGMTEKRMFRNSEPIFCFLIKKEKKVEIKCSFGVENNYNVHVFVCFILYLRNINTFSEGTV